MSILLIHYAFQKQKINFIIQVFYNLRFSVLTNKKVAIIATFLFVSSFTFDKNLDTK
jgi:hypothetical protein